VRTLARFLAKAALVLVAWFLIYLAYYWWDMRRLRAFCDDVKVGTPVSSLITIADQHGVEKHWLEGKGVFDETRNEGVLYVPAASTIGEVACALHHNGLTVTSAKIQD